MRQMLDNPFAQTGYYGFSRLLPRIEGGLYFPHICDLWKPTFTLDANNVLSDATYVLAVKGQACGCYQTTETDTPGVVGRSKAVNIFTLDHFLFPVSCPVEDTWVIVLTSTFPDAQGTVWMVQGNPQPQEMVPFAPIGTQLVYGKAGPAPKGVS